MIERLRFWRVVLAAALALAALGGSGSALARGGGGFRGGGFHGGGFHGGGFHGGCCFGGAFFGFGSPYYGYAPYYPPYYYPPYPSSSPYPYYPPPGYSPAPGGYPTPPAAAAEPGHVVYFALGSDGLDAAAVGAVQQAAADFHAVQQSNGGGNKPVSVIGFTDSSGSAAANDELSRRRCEAVKAALIRDGVPAQAIALSWHGENHAAIPTPNGAPEPQNRRVVILVGVPTPPVS
ncbi:MAG TPA: OmpA family protein [Stellaceae bacterium]|jgi:hypothetical protein